MRVLRRSFIAAAILPLAACLDEAPTPPTAVLPVFEHGPALGVAANGGRNAAVPLSGDEEVPARPTGARGQASFHLDADGETMRYRLIVANIENVVQSHIHIGPAGANGPVAVFLFGPVPAGGGRVNGVIAESSFSADDFIGPLAGMEMSDLVDAMTGGNAYVNVHTNDGVAPTNTGPGDFPGGEVRGQIR